MLYKAPLGIYVIWHPDYHEGQKIGNHIYSRLCRDVSKPLTRSIGVPVYFRQTKIAKTGQPLEIDFSESDFVAIVPLISDEFLLDIDFREYFDKTVSQVEENKATSRVFPVAISPHAFKVSKSISAINFLRVFSSNADVSQYISSNLIHELSRLLMNLKRVSEEKDSLELTTPPPVRLFISHSKHDDALQQAVEFRDFINADTSLKTFFDANDIGYGYDFAEEIKKAAKESALVVFQSDTYSDREWCRTEILTAKSHGSPVVIVNAISKGEKRIFPYLGNYPSIRLNKNFQEIVDLTLEQVLFNIHSAKLLRSQVELYGLDVDFVLSNYPELFSLLELKRLLKEKNKEFSVVIYPDPPLGMEETKLLNMMDDAFYFITPISLPIIQVS
jgi:hypothetical protein